MHKKIPFTAKEIALFKALRKKRVPFLVVGLSAATLQGAPVVTQDIDLWFKDLSDSNFREALKTVGGIYVPSFGMNPPILGGEGFELVDIVTHMHGLKDFNYEYRRSKKIRLGTLELQVLPLERILKSKKTLGRKKDIAVIPALQETLRTIQAKC